MNKSTEKNKSKDKDQKVEEKIIKKPVKKKSKQKKLISTGIAFVNSTFNNTIKIADAIEHLGDTNTKISFPDAGDIISFVAGGIERFKIFNRYYAIDFGHRYKIYKKSC